MKRTTIFVPETLEREIQLCARQQGRPLAALVRDALSEYVVTRRALSRLPSFTGRFDSGRADVAAKHEELLFTRLAPHGAEPARASKTRTSARRRRSSGRRP